MANSGKKTDWCGGGEGKKSFNPIFSLGDEEGVNTSEYITVHKKQQKEWGVVTPVTKHKNRRVAHWDVCGVREKFFMKDAGSGIFLLA